MKPGDRCWGHSTNDEEGFGAAHSTRAAAVADGTREHEGQPFYVRGGVVLDPYRAFDDVLETAQQWAGDNWGYEDFPDVSPEARAELRAYLRTWCSRHIGCRFWELGDGAAERVDPSAEPTDVELAPPAPRSEGGYVLPPSAEPALAVHPEET